MCFLSAFVRSIAKGVSDALALAGYPPPLIEFRQANGNF
jgi:hypothetical protein